MPHTDLMLSHCSAFRYGLHTHHFPNLEVLATESCPHCPTTIVSSQRVIEDRNWLFSVGRSSPNFLLSFLSQVVVQFLSDRGNWGNMLNYNLLVFNDTQHLSASSSTPPTTGLPQTSRKCHFKCRGSLQVSILSSLILRFLD